MESQNKEFIKNNVLNDYVIKAEELMKNNFKWKNKNGEWVDKKQQDFTITTTQIRNLLTIIVDIYNDVILLRTDELPEEICSRIQYLKIRFIYEAGRDKYNNMKKFIEKSCILECLESINGSKKRFILFNRYMEALVAYHRYYGGKDE